MDRQIEIEKESPAISVPIMGTLTAIHTIEGEPAIGFDIGKFLYYDHSLCQVTSTPAEGFVVLVGVGLVESAKCSVMANYVIDHFPVGLEILPPRDRCWVSPHVIVNDRGYKIYCPKCSITTRGTTYAEALDKWFEHCA